MSRKRAPPLLAVMLVGSAVAGAAFFFGKRLRSDDLDRDQDYTLGRRYLARGLAILIALGLFVKAATGADDDEP